MTLYYQDDYVTLFHGDCLTEHREWLTADVLVTDPPYGISWTVGNHPKRGSVPHAGIQNDHDTAVRDSALKAFGSKPSLVFGSFRAPPPSDVRQTLVWKKPIDTGVIGSTTGYRTDTELIFLRGSHKRRHASRSSVLESTGGSGRYKAGHPHSKPTPILEQLIGWTEGVVADPFAGSGTTLVAAKALGRKVIGVELEEKYCEIIAKRCAQESFDFGALA